MQNGRDGAFLHASRYCSAKQFFSADVRGKFQALWEQGLMCLLTLNCSALYGNQVLYALSLTMAVSYKILRHSN